MDGRLALSQDFREFVESLNINNVRYLLVGGYAVACHGHPRYTKDMDLWIAPEPENAARVVKALDQFGFASIGLRAEDFLVLNQVIQLGYPPNRIDLLTSLGDLNFQTCYDARLKVEVSDVMIDLIDIGNLRKSKQIAGRFQDLADLENLK